MGTDGVPSTDSRFPGENRTGRLSMALGTQKKKNIASHIDFFLYVCVGLLLLCLFLLLLLFFFFTIPMTEYDCDSQNETKINNKVRKVKTNLCDTL